VLRLLSKESVRARVVSSSTNRPVAGIKRDSGGKIDALLRAVDNDDLIGIA